MKPTNKDLQKTAAIQIVQQVSKSKPVRNLVISFSGGRSSGRMAHHIKTSYKYRDYNKLFIFANTGKEREETLYFVNECDKRWRLNLVWIEAVVELKKGIGVMGMTTNYKRASRNGEPFSAVIAKRSSGEFVTVPNMNAPYCSDTLKTIPINKFAKEYFNGQKYISAIGMRAEDMPKRICSAELDLHIHERNYKIYPLLEDFPYRQTQNDILDFYKTQGFDLGIHSSLGNCDLCWKKSFAKLDQVLRVEPWRGKWWSKEEKGTGGNFYRTNLSMEDLLKEAQRPKTLDLFQDDNSESCYC